MGIEALETLSGVLAVGLALVLGAAAVAAYFVLGGNSDG